MASNKINSELEYYSNFLKFNFKLLNQDFFVNERFKEHNKLLKHISKRYSFSNSKKEYHNFLIEDDTYIDIILLTSETDLLEFESLTYQNPQNILVHISLIENIQNVNIEKVVSEYPITIFYNYDTFSSCLLNIFKAKHESIKKDEFQIFFENNYNIQEIERDNFKFILENIDFSCYIDFNSFKLKNYNDNFFQLFKEELLNNEKETIFDYFHKDELKDVKIDLIESMKCNLVFTHNIQFMIDGKKHILKGTFIPLRGNNQTFDEIFCRFLDITEEIEVQEEMLLSISELESQINGSIQKPGVSKNKLSYNEDSSTLETTLAMIAHQWRQPLTSISLIVDDMQIKFMLNILSDDIIKEDLKKIGKNVDFLSNTINTFRNYLKNDKKNVIIDVSKEIRKATETLIPLLSKNNVELSININESTNIMEKNGELKQITLNLIKNSFDAFNPNQKNKRIIVNASIRHGKCMIVFNDNAGGIPEQILDRIWEPYFSTKKNLNGTGLGLYMVKNMIEKHMGGQILLKNDNVGASFILILPLSN